MTSFARAVLFASCCAAASAQGPFTSPAGYLAAEGDSYNPWLVATERRLQQVDATHRGAARLGIRSIAFRRDGTVHPGYTQPSKTIDLTVLMGTSDLATFGVAFAANYKVPPVTVVQPRQVSILDWTLAPPVVPATFDLVVPFDQPWDYGGQDDLLWELVMQNSPPPGPGQYWFADGQIADGKNTINGFGIGSGCKVGEFQLGVTSFPIFLALLGSVTSDPRSIELAMYVSPFTPAATVVGIGDRDPNAVLPGLCAAVHTNAVVFVPMTCPGPSCTSRITTPVNPALVGAVFFAQAVRADANQSPVPIALSNGLALAIPPAPPLVLARGCLGSNAAPTGRIDLPVAVARFEQ